MDRRWLTIRSIDYYEQALQLFGYMFDDLDENTNTVVDIGVALELSENVHYLRNKTDFHVSCRPASFLSGFMTQMIYWLFSIIISVTRQ